MHIVFNPKTSPLGNLSHGNNEITCDQKYLVQNCFLGQKEKRKEKTRKLKQRKIMDHPHYGILYTCLYMSVTLQLTRKIFHEGFSNKK